MNPFWERRDHALRRVKLAYLFVIVWMTALAVLVYMTVRLPVGLAVDQIGVLPGLWEVLLVGVVFSVFSWRFTWSYQRSAGRLALVGMGVATPNPKTPNHSRYLTMVDELAVAIGVPCVEPMVSDWMAINVCTVQTATGSIVLVCTEGTLRRRTDRQVRTMVAHALSRAIQPEFLEVANTSVFFGAAGQAAGMKRRSTNSTKIPSLGTVKYLSPVLSLCWKLWRKTSSVEMDLLADQLAAELTGDALALAEAIELTLLQWRGDKWLSPAFEQCACMPLSVTRTERMGSKGSLRASPSVRVGKLVDRVWEASAAAFDGRASVDAQRKEEKQGFHVMRNQVIEGPFLPEEIATRGWLNQQTLVRATGDSGFPSFASKIPAFAAVFEQRENGCPRCSVTLSVVAHGENSFRHCTRCRGYAVGDPTLNALTLERHSSMSPGFRKVVRKSVEREVQDLNENRSQSRIYTDIQCPGCSARMTNLPLDVTSDVVVWRCETCALNWFDAHELPCLDVSLKRETVTWVADEYLVRTAPAPDEFVEGKKFDSRLMAGAAAVERMAEDLLDEKLRSAIGHLGPEEGPTVSAEPKPTKPTSPKPVPRVRLKEESRPVAREAEPEKAPKKPQGSPIPQREEPRVESSTVDEVASASPPSSARSKYPSGGPGPKGDVKGPTPDPSSKPTEAPRQSARSRYPNPDERGASRPSPPTSSSPPKDADPHWYDDGKTEEKKPKKKAGLITAPFVGGDAQESRRRRLIKERQARLRRKPSDADDQTDTSDES